MESFAHYFNKHIAKKIELDDITIILRNEVTR